MRNPFADFLTDEVQIQNAAGQITGPHKCAIAKDKITIFDEKLDVTDGDKAFRPLPNGKAEQYDIQDVQFSNSFHGIPAHFDLTVRRKGSLVPIPGAKVTQITISNSHGFQIGDHNVQHIVDSFKQVISAIDKAEDPKARAEAKSRLKSFLEHPLTSATLGGAVQSLLSHL
jgi:RIP homotypic interaction motif